MADSHPYISGPGNVVHAVNHLRKSFPATITADTFKKLGIASNNESYLINVLRFINVLDENGKKTPDATKTFNQHKDDAFAGAFEALVKKAYNALFDLHGDDSWELDTDALITFFRQSDDTGAAIGKRQANTFRALAGLSGHGEGVATRQGSNTTKKAKTTKKKPSKKKTGQGDPPPPPPKPGSDLGLTVRVEINLPPDGDQGTYDRIFKSIRENLMNG